MGGKRVFIVKVPAAARENMDKFLERLTKALEGDPVLIKAKGDFLRIEVYGGDVLAKRAQLGIRRVLEEYTVHKAPIKGHIRLGRKVIYREAGISIPLDVLELVLSLSGYSARVEGEEIVTSAPVDMVNGLARMIANLLKEIASMDATRNAKRFLAAVGALTGASVLEMIDWGFQEEVLGEDDEGKLYVLVDWREAVKRVLDRQGSGGSRLGGSEYEEAF